MKLERERQVRALLETWGWSAIRAAKGPVDVVANVNGRALHPLTRDRIYLCRACLYVQVKATSGGPYAHFPPDERKIMLELANRAGAEAWLCWWPPRKPCKWINSADWP